MLRSSSFLNRTVCTPEMAFTTVDLPCATWPIVPGNEMAMSLMPLAHRCHLDRLQQLRLYVAAVS